MKLSVMERLILLDTLPREGDFTTLKIVRKLRESLSFSEEEHKELELHQEGISIKWNVSVEIEKDVHIGEKARDIIVESLKKLDQLKKLTDNHFGLYERFVIRLGGVVTNCSP